MKTQVLRTRGLVPVMVGAWMALFGLTSSPTAIAASETRLENIARSEFSRPRTVSGIGLVTGLDGTGDTEGLARAQAYAEALRRAKVVDDDALPQGILKGGGIALVRVEATVQVVGQGGRFVPCTVSVAGGGATSLQGGTLWTTPLEPSEVFLLEGAIDRDVRPVAYAHGVLEVAEGSPTIGRIEGVDQGARVVPTTAFVEDPNTGRREFVDFYDNDFYRRRREVLFDIRNVAHQTIPNAARLADAINEELMEDGFVDLAEIASESGVVVKLPEQENDAFRFAARIEQMMVDFRIIEVPARISWSETRGVLTITGNTRLLDASVAVEGFQIQRLEPARPATLENPDVRLESNVILSGRETPSLSLQAFKQQLEKLQVPARLQAAVLQQLCRDGMLNADFEDLDNS